MRAVLTTSGGQQNIYRNNSSSQGKILQPCFDQQLLQIMLHTSRGRHGVPQQPCKLCPCQKWWRHELGFPPGSPFSFHPLLLPDPASLSPPHRECFGTALHLTRTLKPLKGLVQGIESRLLFQGRPVSGAAC